jgi:DnaJ family protein A protein 2
MNRAQYDQELAGGGGEEDGYGYHDGGDFFSNMFGAQFMDMDDEDGFHFFGMPPPRQHRRKTRGDDMKYTMEVTLEELYNGTVKYLSLEKNVICSMCKGKGGRRGPRPCKVCHGRGFIVKERRMGRMTQQTHITCRKCK